MPQTVEHLAICDLLGISQGLTVISKADAVSASQLHEVTDSIENFFRERFSPKTTRRLYELVQQPAPASKQCEQSY